MELLRIGFFSISHWLANQNRVNPNVVTTGYVIDVTSFYWFDIL